VDSSQEGEAIETPGLLRAPRLGLFGGTFDPVHLGHLHVARTALDSYELDGVLFVPAARSPHKEASTSASPADRLAMLRLALAGEPRFALSDLELRRGAPSFTADTVTELLRQRAGLVGGELFLILGSDNLKGLGSWRDVEAILADTTPIVVARSGVELEVLDGEGLSDRATERLRAGYLDRAPVDVAATELRDALARGAGGEQLPPAVWEYIRGRGIYVAR